MKRIITLLIIASLMLCTACTEPTIPSDKSEVEKKEFNLALLNERWEKELDTNPHVMSEEYDSSYIDFRQSIIDSPVLTYDKSKLPFENIFYPPKKYPTQLKNIVKSLIPVHYYLNRHLFYLNKKGYVRSLSACNVPFATQ